MKLNPHQRIWKYWANWKECQQLPVVLTAFGRKRTQTHSWGRRPIGQQQVASPERGMEPAQRGGAHAWAPAGFWSSFSCHQPLPCLHSWPSRPLKLPCGFRFTTLRDAEDSSVSQVTSMPYLLMHKCDLRLLHEQSDQSLPWPCFSFIFMCAPHSASPDLIIFL